MQCQAAAVFSGRCRLANFLKSYNCFDVSFVFQLAKDLLHPRPEEEKRKHKLKRLVQHPNSYFMDVKCPGCYKITTVFSHAQTVVLCVGCSTVLCQPTGGRARLTEGEKVHSFDITSWNHSATFLNLHNVWILVVLCNSLQSKSRKKIVLKQISTTCNIGWIFRFSRDFCNSVTFSTRSVSLYEIS